ncbi:hypothetical protein ACFQ51_29625 [Streptomyces kaempferi]
MRDLRLVHLASVRRGGFAGVAGSSVPGRPVSASAPVDPASTTAATAVTVRRRALRLPPARMTAWTGATPTSNPSAASVRRG